MFSLAVFIFPIPAKGFVFHNFQLRQVYQDYCEAMSNLSLGIMELLGSSLGVGGTYYREYFEDNDSIMRLNYYPPCQKPDLTLGTGPHCDPASLTILHQDQVGGLEVFVDGKWHSVSPNPDSFVINIGDTFMVIRVDQMAYISRYKMDKMVFPLISLI